MRFVIEPDVETFARRGLAWLERDPVLNTLPATIARSRLAGMPSADTGPPLWITIESDDGDVIGAALRTPPYPPVVPAIGHDVARALTDFLHTDRAIRDLPGVNGPAGPAIAFATRWAELTGCEICTLMRIRLYQLAELDAPTDVPGHFRLASEPDLDLCRSWFDAFAAETPGDHPRADRANVAARVDGGRMGLWDVAGTPVSLAGWSVPASGVVRIGPVYTPPSRRRRGYGAAVTAAASARIVAAGAQVCLFTDLSNPVSNSIYQRIGYRPVTDAVELAFSY